MKKLILPLLLCILALPLSAQILSIYGGKNHDVFLGYLNASKYDPKSIWNTSGTYGNKYNRTCIWNTNCPYGNKYSQYSPWNSAGSCPPILMDKSGNSYGFFTINKYKYKRSTHRVATMICNDYENILGNVSNWYDQNMR